MSVLFAPWAFGSVHPPAVTILNTTGYCLGLLFLGIVLLRFFDSRNHHSQSLEFILILFPFLHSHSRRVRLTVIWILATSSGLLLYVLIQALNSRAVFDPTNMVLIYKDAFIKWLPSSYDGKQSWQYFWRYGALILGFWSTLDWLDRDETRQQTLNLSRKRVTRCLGLLTFSTGTMAIVGMLQRFDGNERLLWIHVPAFPRPDSHFGPFAYRGNASTYFNLMWPAALIFLYYVNQWRHRLTRTRNIKTDVTIWLYPVIGLQILVPAITSSKAGALVTMLNAGLLACVLMFTSKQRGRTMINLVGSVAILIGVGFQIGAKNLQTRASHLVERIRTNPDSIDRLEIYEYAIDSGRNHCCLLYTSPSPRD